MTGRDRMDATPRKHRDFPYGAIMLRNNNGHGCLSLAALLLVGIAHATEPVAVRSRDFDVDYRVNEASLPLGAVSLWFTSDDGNTWQKFGEDDDRQPPIVFHAPDEGLYGLYVLAENSTGPSSTPPTARTAPHLWVFVDETPPVIQLHPLRQTLMLGQRAIQIRWTAIDEHLGARPIDITYQRGSDDTWYPTGAGHLANTGRFDWRVPDEIVGAISIRVSVVDRGGHRTHSERRRLESAPVNAQVEARVEPMGNPVERVASPDPNTRPPIRPAADPIMRNSPIRATERASRLYREAMTHRERGEYTQSISLLREAVKLKPQWADAFAQMADLFYRLGDLDRARDAYEVALRQEPSMRAALRGLAMVHRRNNNYAEAAKSLRGILRYDPNDAEVWMNLGDVAIYQGDDIMARECYLRASQMNPAATQVVADAQKRLELMSDVSRRYRPLPD